MGAIISRARCSNTRTVEKPRKIEALMGAIINHILEKLRKINKKWCTGVVIISIIISLICRKWGTGAVIISITISLICRPVENRRKINKKDESSSQVVHIEEPQIVIKNVERGEKAVIKEITVEEAERWINEYSSSQKILLVGEGDFSFAASLARAFSSAANMTATSLDSREFLKKNYRRAISNIEELQKRGCRVYHGIDATKMANNPSFKGMKFDRIIYNFPFAGFFSTESREFQIRQHQQLVSLFLENAKQMIDEGGEIHITHKTNGFHRKWKIEHLASFQGLQLIGAVSFNIRGYPGYSTKYGFGGDKDFNCNPSKTYKFGLQSAHTERREKGRLQTAR